MSDMGGSGSNLGAASMKGAIQAIINIPRAIYKCVTVIQSIFPTTGALSTSATAGAATALPSPPAKYMTITATDGNAYKVPLYNP